MTRRKLAQVAGCGGGGGGKPVTESDFCSQKAEAECQVSDDCLADAAACKSQRTGFCMTFASAAKSSGMPSSNGSMEPSVTISWQSV